MRTIALVTAVCGVLALAAVPAAPAAADGAAAPWRGATYCEERDAYELSSCGSAPVLPDSPVGVQLEWMLGLLAGAARTVTEEQVREHVSPDLLDAPGGMSAAELVGALQGTFEEFGAMELEGFAYPPREDQAMALVRAASGFRAEVPISVSTPSGLIDSVWVSEATPVIVPEGPHSGWFDVGGGRRVFLRCTGTGSPTVVFDNGLTTDWYALQDELSRSTRVCSYDPARQNGPSSRSDSAPAPRTGDDRVRDLHAVLAAAQVPGPYVLAGHSNGGLFSLLHASRHPADVAGLVLIDGVHPEYHRRTFEALKRLVPHDQWDAAEAQLCAVQSLQVDWEQMDICRAEAQARAQLAAAPLAPMPLAVLSHGVASGPPGPVQDITERVWQQLQVQLAALQPGADRVVATLSEHDIPRMQPELVVREVSRVVRAVREGRHGTGPVATGP